jgi:hypothetical protein
MEEGAVGWQLVGKQLVEKQLAGRQLDSRELVPFTCMFRGSGTSRNDGQQEKFKFWLATCSNALTHSWPGANRQLAKGVVKSVMSTLYFFGRRFLCELSITDRRS